ncbi:uncharacterized protein J3R85_017443 [Psidium guajava]|nr:uncharacterized protein J3R85_017443 [Psidium guajava]
MEDSAGEGNDGVVAALSYEIIIRDLMYGNCLFYLHMLPPKQWQEEDSPENADFTVNK